MITKTQKPEHDQELINHYNTRLSEIERQITSSDELTMSILMHSKQVIMTKLARLYGTEKYGLV